MSNLFQRAAKIVASTAVLTDVSSIVTFVVEIPSATCVIVVDIITPAAGL
jgi:hypothetical protein